MDSNRVIAGTRPGVVAGTRPGVVAGTRIGAEHVRVGRNNQDAFAVLGAGSRSIAVVTDGCSMGAASEVGAVLGASWIASRVMRASGPLSCRAEVEALCEALAVDLDAALGRWTEGDPALVARCFLFTFLAAVVDGDTVSVFGAGDGLYLLGSRGVCVLDSGPDNAPAYAAYRVLGDDVFDGLRPAREVPRVHHVGALERVLIATDGAQALARELPGWMDDPALWRSPRALERRLNQHARALLDDTTVVAIGPLCA